MIEAGKWVEILGISEAAVRRREPVLLLERAKGKDSRNFEQPNLKAQVSKLWHNCERLDGGWQPFSQVNDSLRRSVIEELGRLGQVLHAQRVQTHQAAAYEIGGNRIIGQHDSPEMTRRAV